MKSLLNHLNNWILYPGNKISHSSWPPGEYYIVERISKSADNKNDMIHLLYHDGVSKDFSCMYPRKAFDNGFKTYTSDKETS